MAVGTLTAIPVRGPQVITRRVAGAAMMLAPAGVLPVAVLLGGLAWLTVLVQLPALPAATLCVGALALATRALHLDGLADTADGLAASYDRDRALAVMRKGDTGPAGVCAVVLLLVLQIAGAATMIGRPWGPAGLAAAVLVSRTSLALCCRHGVPSARPSGLGAAVAGTVPGWAAGSIGLVAIAVMSAAAQLTGRPWWQGAIATVVAGLVVAGLVRRCTKRLGGITGDVLGAGVETAFAALLVVLAAG